MKQPNVITLTINARNECWLGLFSGMLVNLGINLQNLNHNLSFNLKISGLKLNYTIDFPDESSTSIEEFIKSYALILLREKPINDLFTEQWQLIKFKQHLDLTALTLKIHNDSDPNSKQNPMEIFDIHDTLGQTLLDTIVN